MSHRIPRVNSLIRDELGEILQRRIKDPRIAQIVSITEVVTSPDLRYAKVFIGVMGTKEEKEATLKGLTSAAGFFRRELAGCLTMRRIPELSFHADDSIERGARVEELIDRLSK